MKKINLSIPQPCHESWEAMTQVEKGKFCSSCQKVVIDFTKMSDRDLATFFKKTQDSVCGRFQQAQLNREINIPRKRIPWVRYFFQFTLPAFLISLKTYAQKEKPVVQHTNIVSACLSGTVGMVSASAVNKTSKHEEGMVKGRVVDAKGNGIAYATVAIKGTTKAAECDSAGNFSIECNKYAVLLGEAVGFVTKEITINEFSFSKIVLNEYQSLGEVVVVMGFTISKPRKPIPLMKRLIDTAFSRFSVYPNPVAKNASFTINTQKIKNGDYSLSFVNMSGAVVQSKEVSISNNEQLISWETGSIARGNYLVRLVNKKSGKIYTEKIIIQ